jgi:hypothetical protein
MQEEKDHSEEPQEESEEDQDKRDYKTRHQVQLVLTEMEHQIC